MQDKFSIGPVNIVQLVGLTAKPRIASVQPDGAVRAADPIPQSAAAGLGDEMLLPINEISSSYLNLKVGPTLNLSADALGAHIALEAGVDRPVVGANAPAPAIDRSSSDNFLPGNNPVDPALLPRGEVTAPDGGGSTIPDAREDIEPNVVTGSVIENPALGYVFDGVGSFGDDQILNFEVNPDQAPTLPESPAEPIMASAEFDAILIMSIFEEFGGVDDFDQSQDPTSDLPLTKSDLTAIDPHPGATDAVPVI